MDFAWFPSLRNETEIARKICYNVPDLAAIAPTSVVNPLFSMNFRSLGRDTRSIKIHRRVES